MASRSKRDLGIDEIVDRAVELGRNADERTLTMSRVAEACGVTPMALYHHVADKEELLTLVVDAVVARALAGFDFPADGSVGPSGDDIGEGWIDDLDDLALRYRNALLDHRAAAQVMLRRPVLSPEIARFTDLLFTGFRRGGLADRDVAEATDALVLLLMGSIANDLTRPPEVRRELPAQLAPGDARQMDDYIDAYADRDPAQRFRNALRWLIAGMLADRRRS